MMNAITRRRTKGEAIRESNAALARFLMEKGGEDGISFCKERKSCMETLENGGTVADVECTDCLIDWLNTPEETTSEEERTVASVTFGITVRRCDECEKSNATETTEQTAHIAALEAANADISEKLKQATRMLEELQRSRGGKSV